MGIIFVKKTASIIIFKQFMSYVLQQDLPGPGLACYVNRDSQAIYVCAKSDFVVYTKKKTRKEKKRDGLAPFFLFLRNCYSV